MVDRLSFLWKPSVQSVSAKGGIAPAFWYCYAQAPRGLQSASAKGGTALDSQPVAENRGGICPGAGPLARPAPAPIMASSHRELRLARSPLQGPRPVRRPAHRTRHLEEP